MGEPKSVADPRWTREQLLKIPTVTPELLDEIEADPRRAVRPTVVETVEGFVTTTNWVLTSTGTEEAWWRGQQNFTWQLQPGIARTKTRKQREVSTAREFISRARTRHPMPCPGKGDLDEWLFLMQHRRKHTRLLDWTLSPLAALYFAVEAGKDDGSDAAVFFLSPSMLNDSQGHGQKVLFPDDPAVERLIQAAFRDSDQTEEAVAIIPPEIDQRMLVQRSRFTIHGGVIPLDDHPSAATFLDKWIVPAKARAPIRRQLRALGIDRASLFPDLENLAMDLND